MIGIQIYVIFYFICYFCGTQGSTTSVPWPALLHKSPGPHSTEWWIQTSEWTNMIIDMIVMIILFIKY